MTLKISSYSKLPEIKKLTVSIGVPWHVFRWLTHYLCKRFQYVCINGSNSNKLLVTSGVPQGSVLGPILFIIYINSITHPTLFDGSMTLFGDDIMIYRSICTPEDLAILQFDIDILISWTEQNFLQFNADTCKYSPENVKQTFPWSPSLHSE